MGTGLPVPIIAAPAIFRTLFVLWVFLDIIVIDKSGNIYFASCDGKLSAIDPAGNTKWYIQLADKINTSLAIGLDNTFLLQPQEY